MMYRNKSRIELSDNCNIPLSPLIDCVFLLLIFFLVTTMLKRKETIIPVTMPDATSSLFAEANDDVVVIGLDESGAFLEPFNRDRYGSLTYRQNRSLEVYLDDLINREGPAAFEKSLRFDIARETPFQKTIDALDTCTLRGFGNVSVKIR
jgi:biopolymer transport protein ExbD